jgi:hypothetical protein
VRCVSGTRGSKVKDCLELAFWDRIVFSSGSVDSVWVVWVGYISSCLVVMSLKALIRSLLSSAQV